VEQRSESLVARSRPAGRQVPTPTPRPPSDGCSLIAPDVSMGLDSAGHDCVVTERMGLPSGWPLVTAQLERQYGRVVTLMAAPEAFDPDAASSMSPSMA